MENYWFDFAEDRSLLQKLQVLVNNTMSTQAKLQKQLTRVLERKVRFIIIHSQQTKPM